MRLKPPGRPALLDYRGREIRLASDRQAARLGSLMRSEPSVLLLEQDETGTIFFTIRARFVRGRLREPRAGRIDSHGRLTWSVP